MVRIIDLILLRLKTFTEIVTFLGQHQQSLPTRVLIFFLKCLGNLFEPKWGIKNRNYESRHIEHTFTLFRWPKGRTEGAF